MDFTDIGFWAYIYIGIVSLISVIECIADKIAAKRKSRRIPEKNLFILSALGGSLAMYITMLLIRHKTKHPSFMVGIPVIIAAQVALFLLIK